MHPRRQACRGPARGQDAVRPRRRVGRMPTLGPDHGGHVVGQRLAMYATRRGERAIKLGMLREPARIGAQESRHISRIAAKARDGGGHAWAADGIMRAIQFG